MEALADWVAGELGDLPGPLVMVGHSLGGGVALELALSHPHLVTGLVLLATGARLPVPAHALERVRVDFPAECERVVRASWHDGPPELLGRGVAAMQSLGQATLTADYTAAAAFDARGRLDEVGVPALVVCGAEDPLTPVWLGEELARGLPLAQMAIIPGTAHVPQLEEPAAVDLLLAAYLARLELTLGEDPGAG